VRDGRGGWSAANALRMVRAFGAANAEGLWAVGGPLRVVGRAVTCVDAPVMGAWAGRAHLAGPLVEKIWGRCTGAVTSMVAAPWDLESRNLGAVVVCAGL